MTGWVEAAVRIAKPAAQKLGIQWEPGLRAIVGWREGCGGKTGRIRYIKSGQGRTEWTYAVGIERNLARDIINSSFTWKERREWIGGANDSRGETKTVRWEEESERLVTGEFDRVSNRVVEEWSKLFKIGFIREINGEEGVT